VDNEQYYEIATEENRWLKAGFVLFVFLLACIGYHHFFVTTSFVEVELQVTEQTPFKLYWAGDQKPYSEKRMVKVEAVPGNTSYSFFLSDVRKISKLRVDTHEYIGSATLGGIKITQEGWQDIVIAPIEDFSKLIPGTQIKDFAVDGEGLHVESNGIDANFDIRITPVRTGGNGLWLFIRFGFIGCVVLGVMYGASYLVRDLRIVPFLLFAVWLLVIAMAGVSKWNVHPDEYVHGAAAKYYSNHWMPPVLEDPAIAHSYSVYGFTRLKNREVFYIFAGKFDKLLEAFKLPDRLTLRAFNVVLFGLIVLYSIYCKYARMVALPFLLSPQLWYAYSYCTSDGFALIVTFLAGCQVVNPSSWLWKYLKDERFMVRAMGFVTVSLLLGLLFLLKKNFYPFIVFFYLCLGVQLFRSGSDTLDRKKMFVRLASLSVVGLILAGASLSTRYYVNGLDMQEKLAKLQEERAHEWYKPSLPLHEMHVSLYMKDRGRSLGEVINQDRWFKKTFQSSFGLMGYSTIKASRYYYDCIKWTSGILLIFFLSSICFRGGWIGSGLGATAFGLSCALIGISLYHSWTQDFQPQGRYLFPVVPMLGMLYGLYHKVVGTRLILLGTVVMSSMGVYFFIFYGLMEIPRAVAQTLS